MPAVKKPESSKRSTVPKNKKKLSTTDKVQKPSFIARLKLVLRAVKVRMQDFLQRRPHRSFRRTRRRDYVRSLKLPGYTAFTHYVAKTLWANKRLFFGVVIIYAALSAVFVGLASQQTYAQLNDTLDETGGDFVAGEWGTLGRAGLLLVAGATGRLNSIQAPEDVGQVTVTIFVFLVTWLTTVWLLRAILAGRKPRLRDGVYSSGSPIVSTFLVSLMLIIQALPAAIAVIGVVVASSSGFMEGGVEAMVFWVAALLLGALSAYWMTSTFIALVVVTLPGMYPVKALKTAGDLVIGRRVRILLRLLWAVIATALTWIVVMIPIILFDMWFKDVAPAIAWLPIVPIAFMVISSLTVVWLASYIYLLYRKVVDDDAAPA